jgi:signal-transduction protein with cAMP-binding, CBS, and nucleotidyltransferase domain
MQSFPDFIRKFTPLTESEYQQFESAFVRTEFKKGSLFAEHGKVCTQIGFLEKGTLRAYYIDSQGDEVTRRLATEPCMISAYESFITGRTCREYHQFLDDSTVICIDRATDLDLMTRFPRYADFRRVAIEMEFVGVLNYLEQLLEKTAEERYHALVSYKPQVLQRVPLQYIASLLGITPTQLSRIRKKAAGL